MNQRTLISIVKKYLRDKYGVTAHSYHIYFTVRRKNKYYFKIYRRDVIEDFTLTLEVE